LQRQDRNKAVAPPTVSGERFGSPVAVGVILSGPQELGLQVFAAGKTD
jgi:hypothetical protein